MSTETQERQAAAQERCHQFNALHPPGTPVRAWPGTRSEKPLVTRTRYSAWVLPSGEPLVSVVGYAGGIHLDHIEHDPTRQPALPDVEFEMPPCPICHKTLDSDGDSLTCSPCGASWPTNGTGGTWDEPNALRCPAVCAPYPKIRPDAREQCTLAQHHDADDHQDHDGITSWKDRGDQYGFGPLPIIDSDGEEI